MGRGGAPGDQLVPGWDPHHQFEGPGEGPGALGAFGQAGVQVRAVGPEAKGIFAGSDVERSQGDTVQFLGWHVGICRGVGTDPQP